MVEKVTQCNEKLSRGEKKTIKALECYKFKKVLNVEKISFLKNNKIVFTIEKPEVLESSLFSNILILGEPKINNYS